MHSDEHRALAGLCKSSTETFDVYPTVVIIVSDHILCTFSPEANLRLSITKSLKSEKPHNLQFQFSELSNKLIGISQF